MFWLSRFNSIVFCFYNFMISSNSFLAQTEIKLNFGWLYEGVVNDPYDGISSQRTNLFKRYVSINIIMSLSNLFFRWFQNINLLLESLIWDYDSKYWRQWHSFKDDNPSFLINITGKNLCQIPNDMRQCGYNVQDWLWLCTHNID